MSTPDKIDQVTTIVVKATVGIAVFFLTLFINDMRKDVRSLLDESILLKEKVNQLERKIDRLETMKQ
jgi:hypothetical protein